MATDTKQPIAMTQKSPMTWADTVAYVLLAAALVGCAIVFRANLREWWLLLWFPLALVMVGFFVPTPRKVELTADQLIIVLWGGKKNILLKDIRYIEKYTSKSRGFLLWGNKGFRTRTAWYTHHGRGQYESYMNDASESILLTMKNGQRIVFSCKNSEEMMAAILNNCGNAEMRESKGNANAHGA